MYKHATSGQFLHEKLKGRGLPPPLDIPCDTTRVLSLGWPYALQLLFTATGHQLLELLLNALCHSLLPLGAERRRVGVVRSMHCVNEPRSSDPSANTAELATVSRTLDCFIDERWICHRSHIDLDAGSTLLSVPRQIGIRDEIIKMGDRLIFVVLYNLRDIWVATQTIAARSQIKYATSTDISNTDGNQWSVTKSTRCFPSGASDKSERGDS